MLKVRGLRVGGKKSEPTARLDADDVEGVNTKTTSGRKGQKTRAAQDKGTLKARARSTQPGSTQSRDALPNISATSTAAAGEESVVKEEADLEIVAFEAPKTVKSKRHTSVDEHSSRHARTIGTACAPCVIRAVSDLKIMCQWKGCDKKRPCMHCEGDKKSPKP